MRKMFCLLLIFALCISVMGVAFAAEDRAIKVSGVKATVLSQTTARIDWEGISGAKKYFVMVNDVCYISTTDTTCTMVNRSPKRNYEVYVIAVLADGTLQKKADADLITVNTSAGAEEATKVSGVKATVLSKTSVRIDWDGISGAKKYFVMVNDVCYSSTTDTTCTLVNRSPERNYEVYVIAVLADGTLQKKADADILTINTAAGAEEAAKVSGVKATVISQTSARIDWDGISGAKKYFVMVNDVCYSSTTDTTCTLANRKPERTYEVYVLAVLANGTIQNKADADVLSVTMQLSQEDTSGIIVGTMDDNFVITLDDSLPADVYTLRYENEHGVVANCHDICTLENNQRAYHSFILKNMVPSGCTKIGVYNAANKRVGGIEMPQSFLKQPTVKQYSFSAMSDVHLGYSTAESDFKKALTYFNITEKVAFNVICGDLSTSGTESELKNFKSIVDQYSGSTKTYVAAGNHEEYAANSSEYFEEYTGNPLYYYFTKGNDVFIMVGIISTHENKLFSDGELQWLYEVLEANRNKRCFVFQHIPVEGSSGDPMNALQGKTTKIANEETSIAFKNLLSHYKNAIHFHGHTHFKLASQEYDDKANYDNLLGTHSVHIPSLSNPRVIDPTGNSAFLGAPEAAEGYVVDVYESGIVLRGVDIINEKLIPLAQYYLDTTIEDVPANSFVDTTEIIKTT
jgi:predicted phosphodiesterase